MVNVDTEMLSPSAELSQFISSTSFEDLPDEAVPLVEESFIDTIGVTLAGSQEEASEIAMKTFRSFGFSGGDASVIGHDYKTSADSAIFVNGVSSHCLDFDDSSRRAVNGHPSVPLIIPICTFAELEPVTGMEAIAAYICGFETMHYLNEAIYPSHYQYGWHATGTLGIFGAAACISYLLESSVEEIRFGLNIAASMSSGLRQNFGSMTKPMHVGQAASNGFKAAFLAKNGFTADNRAIGGENGFLPLYSGEESPKFDALPNLGREWGILKYGITRKKYPCCGSSHTSIAAASRLQEEHGIRPENVEAINVKSSGMVGDVLIHEDPKNKFEAKFSLHYPVAKAIANERIGIVTFNASNIDDTETQAIRERTEFEVDSDLSYDAYDSTVTIKTTDGDKFEHEVAFPPGHVENPLSRKELKQKYVNCADKVISEQEAETLYTKLDNLREQDSVGEIISGK